MKQKRKVKSLFPQKQKDHTLLITAILLILSLILCIGTAALITSFVGASDDNSEAQPYTFDYDGIQNKAETLYGIRFVDPSNISKAINNIFIESGNLYVSPNPVIVNPAKGNGEGIDRNINQNFGKQSHILGGKGNLLSGSNTTIIAGKDNKIELGQMLAVLGGSGNRLHHPGVVSNPKRSLLIGGEGNESYGVVAHLGGKNNRSRLVNDSFIIGGENNYLNQLGGKSVIIGGKNVLIPLQSGVSNIFAYSNGDSTFTPQTSKAFYLNMEKGVGVNTTGGDKGLYVSGAVYIGDIDIDISSNNCTSDNYGVIGSYNGCLVGCTKASSEEIKWEMLDLGAKCKEICDENNKCITTTDINTANNEENKIYTDAQCTNNVSTGDASICSRDENFTGGYLEFYKNVIFETVLLDSDQPCPVNPENQCIYKCNPGYHLTGNVADGSLQCYKDCDLPWNNKIKKKHNETIIAYNITGVSCSNDIYLFPFETKIINKGVPKLSPTNPVLNIQNGKDTNGYSPETCGNYEHKKTLICQKGEWFLVGDNDKAISNTQELAKNYKYESCNLSSYSCDSSYNLTKATITGDRKDTISQWTTIDRGTQNGTRAQYEMCKNYNVNPNPTKNGETCNEGEYRYKFVKCQNGYHTGEGYENVCMKDCTLKNRDGTIKPYRHKEAVTGYVNKTETCTGTCQAANLFCDEGTWKLGSMNGNVDTGHTYNDCVLNAKTCNAYTYNVSHDEYLSGKAHSYYSTGCESYVADGKFACTFTDVRYQLIGCQLGYHTENNKRCVEDVKLEECEAKPKHSTWIESSCYNGSNGEKCTYQNIWTGGWKSSLGGGWNKLYDPDPHCKSTCDEGYSYSDDECTKDKCRGTGPTGDNIIKSNAAPRWNFLSNRTWEYSTGSEEDIKNGSCLWGCKDGYHRLGNTCEFDEKTVNCLTGGAIPEHSDYVVTGVTVTWDSVQNTWNPTPECGWKCNEPEYVLNEAGTGCIEKPGQCNIEYNGKTFTGDINTLKLSDNLCSEGTIDNFKYDKSIHQWTWQCVNGENKASCNAKAAPVAYLLEGKTINNYLDKIDAQDMYRQNQKPSSDKTIYIISEDTSPYEVIVWKINDLTIGLYSEADTIYMNKDSSYMFEGMQVTISDSAINKFNTDYVEDMSYMFCGSALWKLSIPDKINFNTKNVRNMSHMFCHLINSNLDLSSFDTSNVTGMSNMFTDNDNLKSLDLSSFDTSNVTNMSRMFNGGSKLEKIYASDKFSTNGIDAEQFIFAYLYNLQGGAGTQFEEENENNKDYARIDCKDGKPGYFTEKGKNYSCTQNPTYLIPGPDINQSMRDLTTRVNREDIKYFKRSTTDNHEDAENGFDEIQIPDNGYPEVYLWYDSDDKTIYYYTEATTIYMNPDSSKMFYGFGDADPSHFDYGRLEDIDLSDINTSEVENMSHMFELCRNLKSIKLGPDFDTSNVTDMSYMFSSCSSLTNTGLDLSKLDTSKVIDMSSMFAGCSSIKHLNLSLYDKFKTDNVIDMTLMFSSGPELTCNSLSKFNTSKVKNMLGMFGGTQSKSLDLTSFDTSKVTQMSSMFANSNLISVDLTSFNTNKVIRMDSMFSSSEDLTTIYVSENFTISSIDNRNPETEDEPYIAYSTCYSSEHGWDCLNNNMFAGCYKLSTPYATTPILYCQHDKMPGWTAYNQSLCEGARHAHIGTDDEGYNVRGGYFTAKDDNVGDFCAGAIDNAAYLISGPEINAEMIRLAGGVGNIERFEFNEYPPLSGTVTISSSTSRRDVIMWYDNSHKAIYYYTDADKIYMNPDSSKMFNGLYNLSYFDIASDKTYYSKEWNTSNVEDMSSLFEECYKLSDLSPLSNWDTSKVTNMSSMFKNKDADDDSYKAEIQPLSGWDTSSVKNMSSMFEGNKQLTSVNDLDRWDTSSVEDMSRMFAGCESLTEVHLNNWDTSSVKNMSSMFRDCNSIYEIHMEHDEYGESMLVGNWDTSSVEDMSYMFAGCSELYEVELSRWDTSSWDTSNVKNMEGMFRDCTKLSNPGLYNWNTSNVENMSYMFAGCESLNGIDSLIDTDVEQPWDTSSVKDMSNMFAGCVDLSELKINKWETSSVEDMSRMFYACNQIKTLNLSNWDTSKVEKMPEMFGATNNLKTIYASEYFVTNRVTSSTSMFSANHGIKGGNGTTCEYNDCPLDKTYARIDKAGQKGYFTHKAPTPINGVCGTKPYTCESGKLNFSNYGGPLLNRYYTGGETEYIPGYQWDCEGVFSGDTVTGCFTCGDDDYYRCDGNINGYACDINTCAAKHYIFKCFMTSWSNYDEVKDNCTIKNRNNILICTNEENQSCSDNYKACCVRTKDVYYKDYYTENPSGTQEYDNNVGPKVEYKPLYEYQAYVGSDDKKQKVYYESIIPIKYDLGKWIYGTYKSSHGYREKLSE